MKPQHYSALIAARLQVTPIQLAPTSNQLPANLPYAFVNMGMVSGILPVVGIPLALVSYGGTSMVSLLTGFGLLMSVQGDRKLMKS